MRLPKYLSPSALKTFEKNRREYYMRYLADNRPPRLPQTEPMAAGSAFDAYVKAYIHHALFGHYGAENQYQLDIIFESQVEPHNRDFGRKAGQHIFEKYSRCGALADMMFELNKSASEPRFEFSVQGTIDAEIGHIPLLGKPDIFFINDQGARVIFDWKINGYCANSATAPTKGYIKVRDTWSSLEYRNSRGNGMQHKDCILLDYYGIKINSTMPLEECNAEWADQLAIYGWLLGEEVGSEQLVIGIDQVVGSGKSPDGTPYLRVANHRSKITANYQYTLLDRLNYAWSCITSGHIFTDRSREDNDKVIAELDALTTSLAAGDEFANFVNSTSRFQ